VQVLLTYKLIALDIDGTLVNDQHEIMPLTKKIVQRAARNGLMIVLCTGRGPLNTLPILRELGIAGYMLNHNGAMTCYSEPFDVIDQDCFKIRNVEAIIEYCRKQKIHFDVCTANHLYCESLPQLAEQMYEQFLIHPILHENLLQMTEPILKLTLFGTTAEMDQAQRDCALLTRDLSLIRSDTMSIDFVLPHVSKGRALAKLCEQLKISAEQVIAIGNYYNDLQMLEFAGVGVAMGNSPADLQTIADEITLSNNEEGVYYTLKKHLQMNV
jgi:Cof subfamily protein (haloacid dehalogenase superfamily)